MARRPVRQYSRAFTAPGRSRTLTIGKVPPALHAAYTRRAKREGVSVRSLVLGFLQDWANGSIEPGARDIVVHGRPMEPRS